MIPLKFSLDSTELEKNFNCSRIFSIYDLKIIALSRLMLAQTLKNISVYWVAYEQSFAQVALSHGGNDLVGTAFSEIYRAADGLQILLYWNWQLFSKRLGENLFNEIHSLKLFKPLLSCRLFFSFLCTALSFPTCSETNQN